MAIFNMVGGGNGGGGGGRKTYEELKAMSLSDVITELNTDASNYYDELDDGGHIIGIGIANNDNTSYQGWGVSPVIYYNGVWRNGEVIIITMKADENGDLKVPVAGHTSSSLQAASYNWRISYDGGSETQYSGTGSASAITIASGLVADSSHTIVIRPDVEDYYWARAFGFHNSGVSELLQSITYNSSYMGYSSSDTTPGSYFMYNQYSGCTSLVTPCIEFIPNSVTSSGSSFRNYQYSGCTSLTTPAKEVLPSSVTSVGGSFRNYQYSGCTSLTSATQEILPSSVTTIGTYFRSYQYSGCTSLTTPAQEVLPNSVTSVQGNFRAYQYSGCTSLTTPAQEAFPNSVTSIGNNINIAANFRAYQYSGCTSLTTPAQEIFSENVALVGNLFRAYQYNGCTDLEFASPEVFPNSVTTIGQKFRAYQYGGCTSLARAGSEAFSNSVAAIPVDFRIYQYSGCRLDVSADEVLPSSVATIGNNFRAYQYTNNYGLETAGEEALNAVSSIGSNFRRGQYANCQSLIEIRLWIDTSTGGNYYRYQQFYNCTYVQIVRVDGNVGYSSQNAATLSDAALVLVNNNYLSDFVNTNNYPRVRIDDSKFIGLSI